MIIAGAGGHGLEVLQLLLNQGFEANKIFFFDEDPGKQLSQIHQRPVITSWEELKKELAQDPRFCLGVGNPLYRKKLTDKLEKLGGIFTRLSGSFVESNDQGEEIFDQMSFSFLGPNTQIGKGVLINTRANVHHESVVGEFTEIGPGAMLLGNVKVGKMCRIGAGAILLPGISLGDEVTVGAGAVVTKNVGSKNTVIGVPARNLENS